MTDADMPGPDVPLTPDADSVLDPIEAFDAGDDGAANEMGVEIEVDLEADLDPLGLDDDNVPAVADTFDQLSTDEALGADDLHRSEALAGLDDDTTPATQPWETAERAVPSALDDLLEPDSLDAADSTHEAVAASGGADHELDNSLPGLDAPDTLRWPSEAELDVPDIGGGDLDELWSHVSEANGFVAGAALSAALGLGGRRRPRATSSRADVRRDPRALVSELTDLDVSAGLEHGDLADLERALHDGTPLLLTDAADPPEVLRVQAIDRRRAVVTVAATDGSNSEIAIAVFLPLWADTACQMLVVAEPARAIVLPVAVPLALLNTTERLTT